MSESVEQPLFEEQNGASSKPATKRRTTTPKARTTATAKTRSSTSTAAAAKPRAARKTSKKATTDVQDSDQAPLPLETPAPVISEPTPPAPAQAARKEEPALPAEPVPASKPAPRKTEKLKVEASAPSDVTGEEWSPSAKTPATRKKAAPRGRKASSEEATKAPAAQVAQPEAAAQPAPEAPAREAAAEPAAPAARETASSFSEGGVPVALPPPPGRKYPVYIPRHLARQLEQGEQTEEAILAAAQAAAQTSRAESARPERSERHERHERHERQPRHERQEHHERGERHERQESGREPRQEQPPREEEIGSAEGIVEISGKGFGFLRDAKRGFSQHPADVFVTPELVRKYNLRDGQWIKGETRRGGRGSQLHKIEQINGDDPEKARTLPAFDELTVVNPLERIRLETVPERYTTRVIDLMCPIGKGQRGLIVAPPRTGKTTLLQHIADAVVKNHPEITLIMLLVDERPEEVTEIKRSVPNAEVMASSNDMDVKSHTRIAQLAIERAKRLVESGKDVFILLDSITRVGRAFNNATGGGGRTMSGGMDSRALEIPRKLFAAARNTEEAGSLTIIGTALVETGSRMDDLIFQEFKGTGNMELVLDRKISDQRIYPAVDIFQSGTRREELLVSADDLHKIAIIRRGLAGHKPVEAIERLLFFTKKFPTNAQMLREIPG